MFKILKWLPKEVGVGMIILILSTPIITGLASILAKIFEWDFFKYKILIPVWLLIIITAISIPLYYITFSYLFKKKKKREVFEIRGLRYWVEYTIDRNGDYQFSFEPLCPRCNRRLEQIIVSPYMGSSYRKCAYCGASSKNGDFEYLSNKQIKLLILDKLDNKFKRKDLGDIS